MFRLRTPVIRWKITIVPVFHLKAPLYGEGSGNDRKKGDENKVGYKNPPISGQFQKGVSGKTRRRVPTRDRSIIGSWGVSDDQHHTKRVAANLVSTVGQAVFNQPV